MNQDYLSIKESINIKSMRYLVFISLLRAYLQHDIISNSKMVHIIDKDGLFASDSFLRKEK